MKTDILRCKNGCVSTFQDSEYGKLRRIHNEMYGKDGHRGWRCTICGNEVWERGEKK